VDALVAAGNVAASKGIGATQAKRFSRANELAPDRPDILYGLVSAQFARRSDGRRSQKRPKTSRADADDLRSTYLLALALFGAKKWEEAKPYAEQVLAAHPDDREMHLMLVDVALNA